MKKVFITTLTAAILISLLSSCSNYFDRGKLEKVGMLVETSIHDEPWGKKGYKGLMTINEKFDVDVFYEEGIKSEQEVNEAVNDLVNKGVNLIYGHSSTYGKYFVDISKAYPDVHFVYFNGGEFDEDVTSLNFNSHAMGFFGGMVAGEMTQTNHVGVIGAFEWQPEIEGFYEGVKYQNPEAKVALNYLNNWDSHELAMKMYKQMRSDGVDVIYPAGDTYSASIIERAQDDGIYAIGYVSDQHDLAGDTVLTSTVQHVDKLYELTAEKFNKGELRGGVMTFDFQDEAISLGQFSSAVPEAFQNKIHQAVEEYKETGLLPNES